MFIPRANGGIIKNYSLDEMVLCICQTGLALSFDSGQCPSDFRLDNHIRTAAFSYLIYVYCLKAMYTCLYVGAKTQYFLSIASLNITKVYHTILAIEAKPFFGWNQTSGHM